MFTFRRITLARVIFSSSCMFAAIFLSIPNSGAAVQSTVVLNADVIHLKPSTCVYHQISCDVFFFSSLAPEDAITYDSPKHTTIKTNFKRQFITPSIRCTQTSASLLVYENSQTELLAKTNAAVDAIRKNAQIDGQSYQAFDGQLNEIFTSYDTQAQQNYATYLNHYGACPLSTLAPPVLFQTFTP